MKRYKGVVVFRYYQEVTVEVEDDEDDDQTQAIAQAMMYDAFERTNADGESEILDFEEIK